MIPYAIGGGVANIREAFAITFRQTALAVGRAGAEYSHQRAADGVTIANRSRAHLGRRRECAGLRPPVHRRGRAVFSVPWQPRCEHRTVRHWCQSAILMGRWTTAASEVGLTSQTSGTAESKVPFEILCLADAVRSGDADCAYLS